MNGAFDQYTDQELVNMLTRWNRRLTRLKADILLAANETDGMPRAELEHIVAATAERLAVVARTVGGYT